MAYSGTAHGVCCVQDLSKEQADSHKVLVQPALEVAANATVIVLQQLIKNITEQVTKSHCILLRCLLAGLRKTCCCCTAQSQLSKYSCFMQTSTPVCVLLREVIDSAGPCRHLFEHVMATSGPL